MINYISRFLLLPAAALLILSAASQTAAGPISDVQNNVKNAADISEAASANGQDAAAGENESAAKAGQVFTAVPKSSGRYSRVEETPYNRLQFKFAHNSYERDETIPEMLEFNDKFKFQAGCRGVEFDCHQDGGKVGEKDAWRWSVHHDGEYSAEKPQIELYLAQLRSWSERNPGHDPIAVYVEFKDAAGNDGIFSKKFDDIILKKLAGNKREKLFTPADMMARAGGSAGCLAAAAQKAGWPVIRELRGKFIVVITGGDGGDTGARKEFYSKNPENRLAFVDKDCGEGDAKKIPAIESGNRIFLNIHVYHKNKGWHEFCQKAAAYKAFVVRGWKVNAPPLWSDCVKYGMNMLATDKVKNHPWAYIGGGTGAFRVTGN